MDISKIIAAADPAGGSNTTDKTQFGSNYTQFLTLLTTQLKYQDPMNPMDSSEFTNQLVQFSGVEQQIKSNDYLHKLLTVNTLGMTGIGLGMVGLNVYSPGKDFTFNGINAASLSYSMPAGATVGMISILDESGNVVYSAEANLAAGQHTFQWDGTDNEGNAVASGDYVFQVGAQGTDGSALSATTYTSGLVQGVETGEDGSVSVIINDRLVPITDVRQATLQGYAPAAETES